MTASAILSKTYKGKWALVTGASAGIGVALAEDLAAAGANLVLTARRVDRLEALAQRLQEQHGIQTRVIPADLADPAAPQQLYEATEGQGLEIDLLINNAGFGYLGEFLRSDLAFQRTMVDVNCAAVVDLTHRYLPGMVKRRRGDILILASTAAYQPVAYMATYAATKVFDRYFAEALAEEVGRYGVRVSALCPGPTESEFGQVAGSRKEEKRKYQPAAEVARLGLEGLVQGKTWVIPYSGGRIQVFAQRFVPRRIITKAAEKMFRPDTVK
ncbi:SDR family NAD(P)-dependent oxidoreductase [Silvibacterium dinghuense]|uniref:NADP-dependent 3-hydroxy acid dehydrogenase YdfG n=1 Tax=Silvibacterium dinghuense TaxID=1560006 RepID=A0A4Q1SID3_9BACT|nr:SDR family oxidoreductase [Silvibacterium dinghuense]RXS97364.1 SDR family oxidoreductase [Silvibacterium dinghuense]GGG98405.1 dehydrogenase [Silvibacterium dinghuense]